MSTTNLEHTQLITCDLCKRRYNINVYQRHINENQCLKRNHHRLPFESIKQRSIRIGDKTFAVQSQSTKKNLVDVQTSIYQENRQQRLVKNTNKHCQEKFQRILPHNNRQRTLEQAKQLLERRINYKPPWIHRQSNLTKDLSNNALKVRLSARQTERLSPPRTKFKNDDLPLKMSDCRISNPPIRTRSPKLPYHHTPKHQTFSPEQIRSMRKASTWTRPSKQSSVRKVISPIQIPTFRESSSGPSHNRINIPFNRNYEPDEFERYSPTPPSTPKYQPSFTLEEHRSIIRPITYQRAKRDQRQQEHPPLIQQFSSNSMHRKNPPSIFHLPPIHPSSCSKLKHHSTRNLTPWR